MEGRQQQTAGRLRFGVLAELINESKPLSLTIWLFLNPPSSSTVAKLS
jgi:hypothetical protein